MNTYAKILLLVCSILACACNRADSLARVEVQGSVTNRGRPLANGLITFRPVKGAEGPVAGTDIRNGRYRIPADRGPIAGRYEVEIKIVVADDNSQRDRPSQAAKLRSLRMKSFSQPVDISVDASVLDFSLPFGQPPKEKVEPR